MCVTEYHVFALAAIGGRKSRSVPSFTEMFEPVSGKSAKALIHRRSKSLQDKH